MATKSFTDKFEITANYGYKNLNRALERTSKDKSVPTFKIEKYMANKETIRKILKK